MNALMSSLEHFALVKTAITLWNQDDVIQFSKRLYFTLKEWKVTENRVMEKVKELPLPESLKKKVLCFIRPIGIEIRNWMNDFLYFASNQEINIISVVRKGFKKLCWTQQGTVDEPKTAERLIRDEDLSIKACYKLACVNCLKNDILMLWNKMPEDCKKSFYREEGPIHVVQDKLVVLWTYDIKGEMARMYDISEVKWTGCTPYQYAFDYAVINGNKPATEYFFHKLTSEEREGILNRCRPVYNEEYKNGGLSYLLSQTNVVELKGMFRNCSYIMLKCLMDWPLQGLFVEWAKHMWDFISEQVYFYSLREIIRKVKDGYNDYNYQKLFREFWKNSPLTHKNFVIGKSTTSSVLLDLLLIKDQENIKLMLKHATSLDKENTIFSNRGQIICEKLIYEDEIDLLKFFIQEFISSKDLMIKFRVEFESYIKRRCSVEKLEEEKDMWNKVFELLNDLTQKFDKTKCVEHESNGPVKKLRK